MDLADPQQWNPYTYSNNSPVTYSDPTGEIWINDGGGKYVPPPSQPAPSLKEPAPKPKPKPPSCKWYDVKCGAKKAGNWASNHKAEITGFVVGTAVGVGCGALIGWTGVGAVACGAVACGAVACAAVACGAVACGAVACAAGSFVTGYMKGQRGWDLAKTTAIGGAFRAAAGSRGAAALNAARGEISSIARGRVTGGLLGRVCHSFAPGTKVLMADGSRTPIEELKADDKVLATDPETGRTESREVTDTHTNNDTDLADVTITGDDGKATVVKTTQHHPFWSQTRHQ